MISNARCITKQYFDRSLRIDQFNQLLITLKIPFCLKSQYHLLIKYFFNFKALLIKDNASFPVFVFFLYVFSKKFKT